MLYNGRRRHFRTEEGRFFDADPIDLYAYHILAYDAMRLIGCVRVYSLVSNHFSCVTEQILGKKTFLEMLHKLGAQRTETIEIGRWIVHPRLPGEWSSRCAIGCGFCSARNNAWERLIG